MFAAAAFAVLLLPRGPVAADAAVTADAQWAAVRGTFRLRALTGQRGTATGVCVGRKDGFAWVLTAAHAVAEADDREADLFTPASYPVPSRTYKAVATVQKWPVPDVALVKVPVGDEPVPVVPLAKPFDRPKRYPADAVSVGCSDGAAPTCRVEVISARRLVNRPADGVAFFYQTAAPPVAGRSGGPLLDAAGRVIGLAAAAQDNTGFYAHADEILAGLKKAGYAWLWEQ